MLGHAMMMKLRDHEVHVSQASLEASTKFSRISDTASLMGQEKGNFPEIKFKDARNLWADQGNKATNDAILHFLAALSPGCLQNP